VRAVAALGCNLFDQPLALAGLAVADAKEFLADGLCGGDANARAGTLLKGRRL
jgi:hypothetical protein